MKKIIPQIFQIRRKRRTTNKITVGLREEIENFINRRWKPYGGNWLNGNCYWFAYILCGRFKNLDIYYLPVRGHFIAGDKHGNYYDFTGSITVLNDEPVLLKYIKKTDIIWYNRLIRDCVE